MRWLQRSRYYGVIRLLSRLRARVVAFLGPTVQADQERSLRVRMNNFPPPPSPIPSCHDWISGVALPSTLTQTGRPYGASLAFGAAVRLGLPSHTPSRERPQLSKPTSASCSCLRLMVTSNRLHKGLAPSVIHPCLTHPVGLRPPSVPPTTACSVPNILVLSILLPPCPLL